MNPVLPGPVMCIVGARPNFMKMAPILRALAAHAPPLPAFLVHTGQHYDQDMSDKLFEDLRLPRPDLNLEVGSGTHAVQTAEVMRRFEPALDEHKPSCVVVVGDVNSTLACSLVAVKKAVPVVHVEAGLRSWDRRMPEEINRVLTDQIADRLYTTERSAANARVAKVSQDVADKYQGALNDALKKQTTLQAAATRAGRERDSLRKQLSDAEQRLADASPAALIEYASTLNRVFGQCSQRYAELAIRADGHAADAATCRAAWPVISTPRRPAGTTTESKP